MEMLGHAQYYANIYGNIFAFIPGESWMLVGGPWWDFFKSKYRRQDGVFINVPGVVEKGSPRSGISLSLNYRQVTFEKVRWNSGRKMEIGWRVYPDGNLPDLEATNQINAMLGGEPAEE